MTAVISLLLFLLFCSAPLFGQGYKENPVNESLAAGKTSAISSGNQEQIRTFLKDYYLARWTVYDNARLLHNFRKELTTDAASLSGGSKTAFINESIAQLAALAEDSTIAPAVRFNAVLAIGSFNESDQEGAEVPFAPAALKLVELCDAGKKMPDYIVLGALIGLERHAELGIKDEAALKKVVDLFLSTLEISFDRKYGFSQEVVSAMQQKAAAGLAAMKSPAGVGSGTLVLDTFRRLIEDPKTDTFLQDIAAQGIGTMNYEGLADYDFSALAALLPPLLLNLTEQEIEFIETESFRGEIKMGNAPAMGAGAALGPNSGPVGMTTSASGAANIETVLGRIKYDLDSVRIAVSGRDGKGGVRAQLKEDDPNRPVLDAMLLEIEKTNLYLDFGEYSLMEGFDPKKVRLPARNPRTPKVYYVTVPDISYFLKRQQERYSDFSPEP